MPIVIRHQHPTWEDRAEFEAAAIIDEEDGSVEMLPVGRGAEQYVICALPFFAYHYSLGDEVMLGPDNRITSVLKASSIYTYRVCLDERNEAECTTEQLEALRARALQLGDDLEANGFLVEWWNSSYGAIGATSYDKAAELVGILRAKEERGDLCWEAAAG